MARIKSTTSGSHQAKLADKYSYEVYWIMERLKRDKKRQQNKKPNESRFLERG